uniref:Uncharacterized protein n=1 Tax=Rhizophora mucronata TaxID=61149 RepID=A0A2P2P843_RHIMU
MLCCLFGFTQKTNSYAIGWQKDEGIELDNHNLCFQLFSP